MALFEQAPELPLIVGDRRGVGKDFQPKVGIEVNYEATESIHADASHYGWLDCETLADALIPDVAERGTDHA